MKNPRLPAGIRKQALIEAALILTICAVSIATSSALDAFLPDNPIAVLLSLGASVGAGVLVGSVLDGLLNAAYGITGWPTKPGETPNRDGIPKP